MPRRIRQLKADLRAAGFVELPGRGKGSHTVWAHPEQTDVTVTLSGQDGEDAKRYQEGQVTEAINKSKAGNRTAPRRERNP
jgi:predicted RNA binding protein YcfA (HicA-like mRNA interferase family)